MGFDIEYNKDGMFRAVLSGAPGSHNTDLPVLSLPDGEWPWVQNVRQGATSIQLRSALPKGIGGYLVNSGASTGDFYAYRGVARSGATYGPYYGFDSASSGSAYVQFNESANATLLDTDADYGSEKLHSAQVGNDLVIALGGNGSQFCCAGTVHADISITCTTASSTSVTSVTPNLSAGEQLQVVGSYFVCTDDTAATEAVYKIVGATASTLTLDRTFAGSAVGASKNAVITAITRARVTPGIFVTGSSIDQFWEAVCSAWGRLVVATHPLDGPVLTNGARIIRWSGLLGSTEGTSPFTGVWAFSANGYVELDGSVGGILQLIPHADTVVAVCTRALVVLRGVPTFSGTGSLTASEIYPIQNSTERGAISTPYGLFFIDDNEGLMVWSGSGAPRPVSAKRTSTFVTSSGWEEIAYYRDHVILNDNGDFLVYHPPTDRFMRTVSTTQFSRLQQGRIDRNENLVGMTSDGYIINASYMIDDDSPTLNVDGGASEYNMKIVTPYVGDPTVKLRPERVYVTYLLSDGNPVQNPYVKVTLSTGLPVSNDADFDTHQARNKWVSPATKLLNTSDGYNVTARYVTERLEIDYIEPGETLQLTVETVNEAYACEVVQVVVEGSVEGDAGSALA